VLRRAFYPNEATARCTSWGTSPPRFGISRSRFGGLASSGPPYAFARGDPFAPLRSGGRACGAPRDNATTSHQPRRQPDPLTIAVALRRDLRLLKDSSPFPLMTTPISEDPCDFRRSQLLR